MSKTSTAKKTPVKTAAKPKTAPKAAAKTAKKPAARPAAHAKPVAAAKPSPAAKAPVAKVAAPVAAPVVTRRADFKVNDHVVYPAHGVGQIVRIEEQEVAGHKLELFVITFEKDKMTLRVPTPKAKAIGMRKLAGADTVLSAMQTLRGRARIKRTMWSRRAQEYEAKINSGDLISIAEVVRDLHRAGGQPEQSYSERQLYEAALSRMVREVAAVERIDEDAAMKRLESALTKHGGAAAAAAAAPAPVPAA
ncbi:MAG: CarD family transcriptional regulator [Alphaproteobacteria bacterium]|nr:CarD family transcriptional regulator [Alphaproteobacteria bacterium]